MGSFDSLRLALALFLMAPVATAEVAVEIEGPPGCDVSKELDATVRNLSGRGLAEQSLSGTLRLTVEPLEATSAAEPNHFRLTLLLFRGGESHVREIDAGDCDSLARAAGTAVVLLLDGEEGQGARSELDGPSGRASEGAVDPSTEPPVNRRAGLEERAAPSVYRWGVGLGAGLSTLLLPAVAPALEARGSFGGDAWSVGVSFAFVPPSAFRFSTGVTELGLVAGGLRGCRRFGDRVSLEGCLVTEWGAFLASGAPGTAQRAALWATAGGQLSMSYEIAERIRLVLGAPVLVPFERHGVSIDGTLVHRLPALEVRPTFAFETEWP